MFKINWDNVSDELKNTLYDQFQPVLESYRIMETRLYVMLDAMLERTAIYNAWYVPAKWRHMALHHKKKRVRKKYYDRIVKEAKRIKGVRRYG